MGSKRTDKVRRDDGGKCLPAQAGGCPAWKKPTWGVAGGQRLPAAASAGVSLPYNPLSKATGSSQRLTVAICGEAKNKSPDGQGTLFFILSLLVLDF